METVVLRSGIETADALVRTTMVALSELMQTDPICFYELVMVCRDPSHEMWGATGERLVEVGMMVNPAEAHQAVREIVRDAVIGEGLDMQLVDPLRA